MFSMWKFSVYTIVKWGIWEWDIYGINRWDISGKVTYCFGGICSKSTGFQESTLTDHNASHDHSHSKWPFSQITEWFSEDQSRLVLPMCHPYIESVPTLTNNIEQKLIIDKLIILYIIIWGMWCISL